MIHPIAEGRRVTSTRNVAVIVSNRAEMSSPIFVISLQHIGIIHAPWSSPWRHVEASHEPPATAPSSGLNVR